MVNHRGGSDSRSISTRPIPRKKNRRPSSPDRRHATTSNKHGVDAAAAPPVSLTTCATSKNVHSFRSLYQNCRKTSETTERKRQRRESARHHEAEHSQKINSLQQHHHPHPPVTSPTMKRRKLSCNMNSGAVLFFDNIAPQASEQDFLEHLTRNKNSLGNEGKRNGDFHVVNIDYELSESGSKNRAFVELSTRAEARRAEQQIDTLFQGRHFDMELNSCPTSSPREVSYSSVRPFSPSASPRSKDRDSNNNNPSRGVVAALAASAANEKALHAPSLTAPKHRHSRCRPNHPHMHRASAPSPNHVNDLNNPERQQEVRRGNHLVPPTNANKKCRSTAPAAEHGRDSNSQRRPRASDEHRDNSNNARDRETNKTKETKFSEFRELEWIHFCLQVVPRKDTISERRTPASGDPTDNSDHDGGSNESRPSSQRNQSRKRISDTRNQSVINVGYHQSPRRRCNSSSSSSSSQDVKVELEDSQLQQGTSPFQPYCGNNEIPVGTSDSNSNNDSDNTKRNSCSSRSNQNQNDIEGDSIRPDAIMSDSVYNSNRETEKDDENRVAQNHEQNPMAQDRDTEDEAYETLRAKYDASIAEVEQWKRRHEEVTRSNQSKVIEMECLFEQAKVNQTELRKLKSAYQDERKTLGNQIQKLHFECERAKAETDDWKKQCNKLRSDVEEKSTVSSEEIEKTRKAFAEAVRKTREMVDAKSRFSKGLEDEHQKSLKLSEEANELREKIQELTAEHTAKITLQQDKILQLEKEIQNKLIKHQGEITAATNQKNAYLIRIGKLEAMLEKSNAGNKDRNDLHQKLRDEITRKHKEELEKAKSTAAAAARYQSDLKWEERIAKEAKDLDAANQKWKEETLGKHQEDVEKAKLAAAAAARKEADLRWEDRFCNQTRDLEAANQKWKEEILQAHREELQETKTAAAHAARTQSDIKWEDRLANEAIDRDEADQKRREKVLQTHKEELKNAQSAAAAAAASELETLKKSMKQSQQEVQILEEQAREQSKAEQNLRDEMLRKHELELEEARSLSLSSCSAADVSSRATPKRRAIAIGLQQELDQKTKECVKLQENFNKIAMQNSKHSDTIEELRKEINELKNRFQYSYGGPRIPLKIED